MCQWSEIQTRSLKVDLETNLSTEICSGDPLALSGKRASSHMAVVLAEGYTRRITIQQKIKSTWSELQVGYFNDLKDAKKGTLWSSMMISPGATKR